MTELDLDIYDFKHDLKSAGDAFWGRYRAVGRGNRFFDDMDGVVVEKCILQMTVRAS